VLWFTDGLSECVDERGEMLGSEGILKVLATMTDLPPTEVVPALLRRVSEMAKANLSEDDLTVLLTCDFATAGSAPAS
jgi:serine phosphatase RsbU (regulator of sigma subunit)